MRWLTLAIISLISMPLLLSADTNTDDERKSAVKEFQEGSARFMISNQSLGGMGQTWTAASVEIYYSNSFSYEDRMQSEDRAHRRGSEIHESITIVDIEANTGNVR